MDSLNHNKGIAKKLNSRKNKNYGTKTKSEYLEILSNVKKVTDKLIVKLNEYGNGNTVLTEELASEIRKKFRDSKIDEILKKE
ncbi:hypothetical protein [Flavobacterium sasangense]|uniref:hypothetical protein n=1 Tax=Flavobacterium sasangense TaxID=503361 RepID=UPI00047D1A17|nr:hypothetical protein [Flavobacterium sasangense]